MSIESESVEEIKKSRKVIETVQDWLAYKHKEEWLKDMRGSLSLVASIIATMSFQIAVNPPGGVFQSSTKDDLKAYHINLKNVTYYILPGQAVLGAVFPEDYSNFLVWNTVCFVSSLCVCFLLVSEEALNHRLLLWLLSMLMCLTTTSFAFTYLFCVLKVTPDPVFGRDGKILKALLYLWISLMGIAGLALVLRPVFWGYRKWNESRKNSQ